jgi:hypothetical protein
MLGYSRLGGYISSADLRLVRSSELGQMRRQCNEAVGLNLDHLRTGQWSINAVLEIRCSEVPYMKGFAQKISAVNQPLSLAIRRSPTALHDGPR